MWGEPSSALLPSGIGILPAVRYRHPTGGQAQTIGMPMPQSGARLRGVIQLPGPVTAATRATRPGHPWLARHSRRCRRLRRLACRSSRIIAAAASRSPLGCMRNSAARRPGPPSRGNLVSRGCAIWMTVSPPSASRMVTVAGRRRAPRRPDRRRGAAVYVSRLHLRQLFGESCTFFWFNSTYGSGRTSTRRRPWRARAYRRSRPSRRRYPPASNVKSRGSISSAVSTRYTVSSSSKTNGSSSLHHRVRDLVLQGDAARSSSSASAGRGFGWLSAAPRPASELDRDPGSSCLQLPHRHG